MIQPTEFFFLLPFPHISGVVLEQDYKRQRRKNKRKRFSPSSNCFSWQRFSSLFSVAMATNQKLPLSLCGHILLCFVFFFPEYVFYVKSRRHWCEGKMSPLVAGRFPVGSLSLPIRVPSRMGFRIITILQGRLIPVHPSQLPNCPEALLAAFDGEALGF